MKCKMLADLCDPLPPNKSHAQYKETLLKHLTDLTGEVNTNPTGDSLGCMEKEGNREGRKEVNTDEEKTGAT